MDIEKLQQFFMWCSIINGALLVFSALICTFGRGWIYKIHSKLFPMPEETFNVVIYFILGFFKILFFLFFLTPYIALVLMK